MRRVNAVTVALILPDKKSYVSVNVFSTVGVRPPDDGLAVRMAAERRGGRDPAQVGQGERRELRYSTVERDIFARRHRVAFAGHQRRRHQSGVSQPYRPAAPEQHGAEPRIFLQLHIAGQVHTAGDQRHVRPGHDVLFSVHRGRRVGQPSYKRQRHILRAEHVVFAVLPRIFQQDPTVFRSENVSVINLYMYIYKFREYRIIVIVL